MQSFYNFPLFLPFLLSNRSFGAKLLANAQSQAAAAPNKVRKFFTSNPYFLLVSSHNL
jgi:predicted metalloprotease